MPDDTDLQFLFVVTRTIDYSCALLGVFSSLDAVKDCIVASLQKKWGAAISGLEHYTELVPAVQASEIEITENLEVQFSRGGRVIHKLHNIYRVPINESIEELLYRE